jgi:glycosyltransferase involved in cell wall biosynthesis
VHTLALFFTRNISLKLWVDAGLFDREKQLYEEHLRRGHFKKVYWLTYGTDDAEIASELKTAGRLHPDIIVLSMSRFFSGKWGCLLYSFLMPLFFRRRLKSADIFKTNQMDGSWSAVIAKWLYHKPLIVRTGYTVSLFAEKQANAKSKRNYEGMERFAYRHADIGVVTSRRDKQYICSKYHISSEKIEVLHNYINTAIFYPTDCEKYADRIIFVGRLQPQKNLFNLIEAVSDNNLTLDICGEGDLRNQLEHKAKQLNIQVNFMGVVPNQQLPEILNRYQYFILPSFYEGMPKTLLEAMACGLVCIGTNVEGTNEVIEDGVSGYLAHRTDAESVSKAIKKAMQLSHHSITEEGIRRIRDKFSLETIVEREKQVIASLKM